jgi:Rieske Fe-S protein
LPPITAPWWRHGLTKVAVYRDCDGELHSCSAVCPHLKAIVTWNDAEKTWDCPAHGSRFDKFGKVIQGPANSDLEVKEPAESSQPK